MKIRVCETLAVDRFDLVLRSHLENVGLLLTRTQELLAQSARERQAQVSISVKLH